MAPINRVSVVTCDRSLLYFKWGRRTTVSVNWDEVQRVLIRTTDKGPFDDDVFFIVETSGKSYVIPQQAVGAGQLLENLQRLPGFDNEAVIDSMGCADNKDFLCWERGADIGNS
jgi:hypothetical protein